MLSLEPTPSSRPRLGLLSLAAGAVLIPALHPLLRPTVGVPSHLLWFAHTLPVALIAYHFGLAGAGAAILGSMSWVALGEHLFGAGYGISADEATILAMTAAVGFTDALVAGFALLVRAEQGRRQDLARMVIAALSASNEAVLWLDQHRNIQYANDAARRLFETEPGELRGSPLGRLLGEEAGALGAESGASGGGMPVQIVARTITGRPFAAEASVSPVRDGQRGPIAYLVTLRDQSERLRREQAQRRAQALSELGTAMASIAHELNNPLAAVVAYAELLERAPGISPQAQEDLHVLAHQARRAAGIARQLLNLVRRGERRCEAVNLNQLVERALKGRGVSFAAHGIRVSFTPAADLNPVCVDVGEIEQLLVNLLANAEQAMHQAHGQGHLHLATRNAGGMVEVVVADDGPGIAPEHLPRIFETFFTTKPVGVGTGLGLSIARRIARDHGGDLLVESEEGRGATFTLRLPMADAMPAAEPRAKAVELTVTAPARSVLIVDDEPAIRRSLERLLRERGFQVEAAGNFTEALACLEARAFDLVLCDIHLGEQSGLELYRVVVARRPELERRFVFVTGDVLGPEVQEFFAATSARHLAKPFELTELLNQMAEASAG